MRIRCLLPGVLVAAVLLAAVAPASGEPLDWPTAVPEEAGFRSDLGESLDRAVAEGKLAGLHGVVVAKDGRLVLERYFEGIDWRWGMPLGRVDFGPDTLHDLRSVTKSVVSLLYGIALADGLVPPPEAILVDRFPEYPDLMEDPERRRMTVGDALSMRLGTAWNEELPYDDPRNSEIRMERSPDRYRFVLEQPLETEPGTRWNYNGGATALIARLIERGTGLSLADFARERLFEPLGIVGFYWTRGNDGAHSAASGLRLRPRDLAKIGQLVLDGGRWGGRQVVPESWLEASFEPRALLSYGLRYGYFWWLSGEEAPEPWMAGFGNGGQRLFVQPGTGLVVAVTAGNYNKKDAWKLPVAVITEHVLPAMTDR